MANITIEKADYIIAYYSNLLTLQEATALRHHRSTLKLEHVKNPAMVRMYYNKGLLSDDPIILNSLTNGYVQFILNCVGRILHDNPDQVFFNLCPVCQKLARTPEAKQCRWCGHDWH
ncbi:hypothetical protein [Mucilaginibacter sp.]